LSFFSFLSAIEETGGIPEKKDPVKTIDDINKQLELPDRIDLKEKPTIKKSRKK